MSVIHPDTLIVSEVETEYIHAPAPQPVVEIVSEVETEYTSPPSSGGQPSLIITVTSDGVIGWMGGTTDITGEAHIDHATSGKLSVLVPPQEPNDFTYENVDIVKVKMPKPTLFDKFGRPIG